MSFPFRRKVPLAAAAALATSAPMASLAQAAPTVIKSSRVVVPDTCKGKGAPPFEA